MSRSRKATGGAGTATPDMPEGAAPPGFPRAGARRMNIDEYYIRMEAAALPRAPGREAGSYGGLPSGTHGTADGGRRRGRRLCRDSRLGIGQKPLRELWSMPGRRGMPSRGGAFPAGKSPGGSGCRALFRRQGGGAGGHGPRVFVIFYWFSHHIFVRIFLHISLKNLIFSNMTKNVPHR